MRFLRFVPIAVFAALVAPNLAGDRGEWLERVIAAVLAGVAAWHTRQLWVAIVVGVVVFWLLRAV
jgi:branched-subunit amino acid transport protein